MNCGDTIVNGSAEYHELEVDMEEFCFGKSNGVYYIGPTEFNQADFYVLHEDGLMFYQEIRSFKPGEGFQVSCPKNETYKIKWH